MLVLSVIALVIDQFMVDIPFWMIILPMGTQVAQWFIAWLPGTNWQLVIGKALVLIVACAQIVIGAMPNVNFEILVMLIPIVSGIAQIIISKYGAGEPDRLAA